MRKQQAQVDTAAVEPGGPPAENVNGHTGTVSYCPQCGQERNTLAHPGGSLVCALCGGPVQGAAPSATSGTGAAPASPSTGGWWFENRSGSTPAAEPSPAATAEVQPAVSPVQEQVSEAGEPPAPSPETPSI